MTAVLRHSEMVAIDRFARQQLGIPEMSLIESAGLQAQAELEARRWPADPGRWAGADRRPLAPPAPLHGAVYAVGRGNNGADALVMARHAHAHGARDLRVLQVGKPPADGTPAAVHLDAVRRLGLRVDVVGDDAAGGGVAAALQPAPLVVDGICGTGIRGRLRGAARDMVRAINGCDAAVAAVDVPSGMHDGEDGEVGECVRAQLTLAMGAPKRCLYLPANRMASGEVVVLDCGFPPELLRPEHARGRLLELGALPATLPRIGDDAHKGVRGHVALLGGARGTAGAVRLAAESAGRTSAGLVTVITDAEVVDVMAPTLPSAMWRPLADPSGGDLSRVLARCDAVAVGPGWGQSDQRLELLRAVLAVVEQAAGSAAPAGGCDRGVIDADGLNLLATLRGEEGGCCDLGGLWVLTPHPAELARLSRTSVAAILAAPDQAAAQAAAEWNATVVLKGHVTVVSDRDHDRFLDAPNAALATGGSGDVLAGVVASLLAGGASPVQAAQGGVLLHAAAARLARRERGWFLAEELPIYLGRCAERAAAEGAVFR